DSADLYGVRGLSHAQPARDDGRLDAISEFDGIGLLFKRPNRRIEVHVERFNGIVRPPGFHSDLSRDLTVVQQEAHRRRILQFAFRERYLAAYWISISSNTGRFPHG